MEDRTLLIYQLFDNDGPDFEIEFPTYENARAFVEKYQDGFSFYAYEPIDACED